MIVVAALSIDVHRTCAGFGELHVKERQQYGQSSKSDKSQPYNSYTSRRTNLADYILYCCILLCSFR